MSDQTDEPQFRCETCQETATIHIPRIGCHFCASCLPKIDARIKEMIDGLRKTNLPHLIPCACVHHDPYECARLRDRRSRDPDDENENSTDRRACLCECHAKDTDELDDPP